MLKAETMECAVSPANTITNTSLLLHNIQNWHINKYIQYIYCISATMRTCTVKSSWLLYIFSCSYMLYENQRLSHCFQVHRMWKQTLSSIGAIPYKGIQGHATDMQSLQHKWLISADEVVCKKRTTYGFKSNVVFACSAAHCFDKLAESCTSKGLKSQVLSEHDYAQCSFG